MIKKLQYENISSRTQLLKMIRRKSFTNNVI